MDQNPPIATFRDGRLKATVWENTNESGEAYHSVTLSKTYEDAKGKLKDTNSFSHGELLSVRELAREARSFVLDIHRDLAIERKAEREQSQDDRRNERPGREDRPARFQKQSQPSLER